MMKALSLRRKEGLEKKTKINKIREPGVAQAV
jgi:hypothetical protein